MKKIVAVLDHAPNYREQFLRELGKYFNLTVYAQACKEDYLTPPEERINYIYKEYAPHKLLGLKFHPGLRKLLKEESPDCILVNFNLRQPSRLLAFSLCSSLRKKWIWRGRIIGKIDQTFWGRLLKKIFLSRAPAVLVYSKEDEAFCVRNYNRNSITFNNTEISQNEFTATERNKDTNFKLLFVGRYQERKRLDRLLKLTLEFPQLRVKVIGPNSDRLKDDPLYATAKSKIQLHPPTYGDELKDYFSWCDAVINPGHAGLLVMNAAKHGKPIIVDQFSQHAPEIQLAKEAKQFFVDFSSPKDATDSLRKIWNSDQELDEAGHRLQKIAKSEYTVEKMALIHAETIEDLISVSKKG